MKVLVIGNGGRENALVWAIKRSPKVSAVYALPGNGGTAQYAQNVELPLKPPYTEVIEFIKKNKIEMTVIGPEQPLVDGIVDYLKKAGIHAFGPSKGAARLEGSKAVMKEFMQKNGIPTARFRIFTTPSEAIDFVNQTQKPYVVKTDGLAAGKGAIVCKTVEETLHAIKRIMVNREFGTAGDKVVLEDVLSGTEVSVFIATDGKDFVWLASAQDHKRIYDNDEGPNTGGMGAYAPTPFLNASLERLIIDNIVQPTITGMAKEGYPYTGILYVGLMLTQSGPSVIEYNVRFGDPEAEVVLPLLKTDLVDIIQAVNERRLGSLSIHHHEGYCTGVVLASSGYPSDYQKGARIEGDLSEHESSFIFHAGTKMDNGIQTTNGGRVLCVSALGKTLEESIENAYQRVGKIHFEGMQFRTDIGKKGLKALKK